MHHHCFHSACQAWCLMTKEVKACPLFPRGNHISLHRLLRSSLPRYYCCSTICDRSDRRNKLCHYYIQGVLVNKSFNFQHCSLYTLQSAHPYKYAGENIDLQGLNVLKVCPYSTICFMSRLVIKIKIKPFIGLHHLCNTTSPTSILSWISFYGHCSYVLGLRCMRCALNIMLECDLFVMWKTFRPLLCFMALVYNF